MGIAAKSRARRWPICLGNLPKTRLFRRWAHSSWPLDVRSEGPIEQCCEGMPGGGHSNRHGESYGRENQRRCPHGRAVNAADRDDFVNDENEEPDAESGDRSSGGRQSEAGPGKAAESCANECHCGDQNETLVRIGPAPGPPRKVDDDGEAGDADQWYGSGDGRVERADLDSPMKCVDGSHHAEHDHDRGKAEGDRAQGTMPLDAASGDERGLDDDSSIQRVKTAPWT
jgi:hypothetical protein